MTATISDTFVIEPPQPRCTLILFCTDNTAELAALASALARGGVRLMVRPHIPTDELGPNATDVQALLKQIQDYSPDAVLATGPWTLAMAALTAARQARRPFIYRIEAHLGDSEADQDRYATAAQAAECVLIHDDVTQLKLVARGVAPKKLHLAHAPDAQAEAVLHFLRSR